VEWQLCLRTRLTCKDTLPRDETSKGTTADFRSLVVAPAAKGSPATMSRATPRKAWTLGASLTYVQPTILQHLAVQASDGLLKVCPLGKLNESKSFGIARHLVADHLCRCNLEARVTYEVGQVRISDIAREITYK